MMMHKCYKVTEFTTHHTFISTCLAFGTLHMSWLRDLQTKFTSTHWKFLYNVYKYNYNMLFSISYALYLYTVFTRTYEIASAKQTNKLFPTSYGTATAITQREKRWITSTKQNFDKRLLLSYRDEYLQFFFTQIQKG